MISPNFRSRCEARRVFGARPRHRGYSARISSAALGRTLTAFVEVKLERASADVFDAFAQAVRETEAIEDCHMVAGGYDDLLKTRHADMAAYRAFPSETLLALPGIRETRTFTVMEEVKSDGVVRAG